MTITEQYCSYSAPLGPFNFWALFREKLIENARSTNQVHLRFSIHFSQKITSKLKVVVDLLLKLVTTYALPCFHAYRQFKRHHLPCH